MATSAFYKFNCLTEDLAEGGHNWAADTLKAFFTNTVPNVADTVVNETGATLVVGTTSNAAEITAANNYSKGGVTVSLNTSSQSGGVYKLIVNDPTFVATGNIGTFRYVVLYNATSRTNATRCPIGWYDYGTGLNMTNNESLLLDFDGANGVLSMNVT